MTMLTAKEILERHPQGCWVFDVTGRLIRDVMRCNPETGEVVRLEPTVVPLQRFMMLFRRIPRWEWTYSLELSRRHGFWPAPLQIVPKPIWNGDPEQYAPVPRRSAAEREALL